LNGESLKQFYQKRNSPALRARLRRFFEPPLPLIHNPSEPKNFRLGRYNLYLGGAGREVKGFVNLDLFAMPGVDVAADAHALPFPAGRFTTIECDAVLEHVRCPEQVMREMERVLEPGGYIHIVAPFCHPFHEYPKDYRRFSPDGLKELAPNLQVVAEGWRTGPTATLLLFVINYVKLWFDWRPWRVFVHGVLGWTLFPLRYLDLLFFKSSRAGTLGNHCFLWLRKPLAGERTEEKFT
jgi:SAM-dependent methyltransferase